VTRRAHRDESPFITPRRLPRERYVEMGRKGGEAKGRRRALLQLASAPSLRSVIDRTDLRRSAADAYGRALVELHDARAAAETAYWSRDAAAIRRALRWVAAANVVADLRYDELLSI
jgi:hypothetical protein